MPCACETDTYEFAVLIVLLAATALARDVKVQERRFFRDGIDDSPPAKLVIVDGLWLVELRLCFMFLRARFHVAAKNGAQHLSHTDSQPSNAVSVRMAMMRVRKMRMGVRDGVVTM